METELQELKTEAMRFASLAHGVTINDATSNDMVAGWAKSLKKRITEIKEKFLEPKRKAHEAHKAITKFESETLAPIESALVSVNKELARWDYLQILLRRDEQRRLEAIARKEAEDARDADAFLADEDGHTEEAIQILDSPVMVPMVVLAPVEKVQGLSFSETWGVDETCIIDAKLVPRQFLIPDIKTLNALAKAQKGNFNVAGVKAFVKKTARHTL